MMRRYSNDDNVTLLMQIARNQRMAKKRKEINRHKKRKKKTVKQKEQIYSLSRKTVNIRENFWNALRFRDQSDTR